MNDLLFYSLVAVNLFATMLFFFMMVRINSLQSRLDAHDRMLNLLNQAGMESVKMMALLKDVIFETGKAEDKPDGISI